jgi:hypothetical protein
MRGWEMTLSKVEKHWDPNGMGSSTLPLGLKGLIPGWEKAKAAGILGSLLESGPRKNETEELWQGLLSPWSGHCFQAAHLQLSQGLDGSWVSMVGWV